MLSASRGSTNTEPEADRGPRAGSPRGVVDAPGSLLRCTYVSRSDAIKKLLVFFVLEPMLRRPGRYRFRFCIRRPAMQVMAFCAKPSQRKKSLYYKRVVLELAMRQTRDGLNVMGLREHIKTND